MEPDVVENYLKVVANLEAKVILLRNMKEGKQKAQHFLSSWEIKDNIDLPAQAEDFFGGGKKGASREEIINAMMKKNPDYTEAEVIATLEERGAI